MPEPTKTNSILLAHIAGAHGIRGEVLLKTYTGAPADVAAYGPLSDQAGRQTFTVRVVRVTPKGVIARIKGVADRTAAEALKGTALYVDRAKLPPPDAEEFYHTDLIGLTAVDDTATAIGTIDRVLDFGAGAMLEIKLTGQAKTELVPFTKVCVPTIDLTVGRVTVVIPTTVLGEDEPRSDQGD